MKLSCCTRRVLRVLADAADWLRSKVAEDRPAHDHESIAYYQHVEREDERSKGALWL